jgi:alpha-L-rhamnosidase
MAPRKRKVPKLTRRDFFRTSALGGLSLPLMAFSSEDKKGDRNQQADKPMPIPSIPAPSQHALDLTPAAWIWYPSARTLSNTVILFRKTLRLDAPPKKAIGWIAADSRYRLFVNGKRIQWGPAPCDPRWLEADPLDLSSALHAGENVIGVEVLYYGFGDGTYPMGKPGFIFNLVIEATDGGKTNVLSDLTWKTALAKSWRPGSYKRWYLRSLQEQFDARLYPFGWLDPQFVADDSWMSPIDISCPADKPPVCSAYPEYALEIRGTKAVSELRRRSIPLLHEHNVQVKQLAESLWIRWKRPPEEYFDSSTNDSYVADRTVAAEQIDTGSWKTKLDGTLGAALTFELEEQIVGWPFFTIEAPEGTVVELMVQESHEVGGPPLLNTQFYAWSRFICRNGVNTFETFDFESCRWMQLHIHGAAGDVVVRNIGVRRRMFPWPGRPDIKCSEPALQRLFDASVNTLYNSAQETIVDGMARERQQYSGDGGHQLHAIYSAFGDTRLTARYMTTFSQGMTIDGYFLDCWPAYDRLARLMERQLQLTFWGPLLDHGVGFNFDCWHHYLYTADLEALREPYPRLLRFFNYLKSIRADDGLLPAENLGVPSLYIDHNAYKMQRHKQCAFNLYTAAMLQNALAPLCDAFGDRKWSKDARGVGSALLKQTIAKYWDAKSGLFIDNLPWRREEKEIRLSDRTLATSVLFDQCPGGKVNPALDALANLPPEMGFSYPANAGWRLWALAKGGRSEAVVKDLRARWAPMDSVLMNNTLQEFWIEKPDSTSQWSHCAVVPLYVLYMNIAGIRALEPGFKRYEIVPQFADIEDIAFTANTVVGSIRMQSKGSTGNRVISLEIPKGGDGEIALDPRESVELRKMKGKGTLGRSRYRLPAGEKVVLSLKYT